MIPDSDLRLKPPHPERLTPSADEMAAAREVQLCLLPRQYPELATLEYRSYYVPARGIGGDYFDFLVNGPGHLGFAVGDISGKGVSAALMMAALQAALRTQFAADASDLPRLLGSINGLICECTAPHHFASLFLGDYDDRNRKMSFANCGHVAPLLLRADDSVDSLDATATVLGAFDDWRCTVAEVELMDGDILVLFTDGITESNNRTGEEFGDERLVQTLRANRTRPLGEILGALVCAVRGFGDARQGDDMTLVVARPR